MNENEIELTNLLPKKLKKLLKYLEIEDGPSAFVRMSDDDWIKILKDKENDSAKQNEKMLLDHIILNFPKKTDIVDALAENSTSDKTKNYESLFQAAVGTTAHQANQQRLTNTNNSLLANELAYVISGDTPEEVEANKQKILGEYDKFLTKKYPGTENADKRKELEPKKEHFKSFKDFEQSETFKTLDREYQEGYRKESHNFPKEIITLPFKDKEEGKKFMDDLKNGKFIKEPSQAAKTENLQSNQNSPNPLSTRPTPGVTS